MSILSENFPFDSIVKQKTTLIDLPELDSDNNLLLQGMLPGDFLIIDNNNKVVDVPQYYNQNGVLLDFSNILSDNSSSSSDGLDGWKIMYYPILIMNGNFQDLMKLSLIFN